MQDQEISKFIIKTIGSLRAETIPETGIVHQDNQEDEDLGCCNDDSNCSCLFDSNDHPKTQHNN